jgi:hypothetical protein
MKTLKETLNEGWTGSKANRAYDEMVEAFGMMGGEKTTDCIWNYFSSDDIEGLYEFMKEEGYIY